MQKVLDIFKKISKIPRCSYNALAIKNFLVNYAKEKNLKVQSDKFDNILISKSNPKVCLQAHYDMVCIGDYKNLKVIEKKGFLMAKNSSLGADNGIAIAMMLALIDSYNIELLFTSDEEVGLIGAMNLELKIKSKNIINLDSEDDRDVTLGCAGGFDISGKFKIKEAKLKEENIYKITSQNFEGGHSGIDINSGIKNAIKELAYNLSKNSDVKLISINGGEKINSIAKNIEVILATNNKINIDKKYFKVQKINNIDKKYVTYIKNSKKLIHLLNAMPSSILSFDRDFSVPSNSINLSLITQKNKFIKIELMGRANSNEELDINISQIKSLLKVNCKNIKISNIYPAWKPIKSKLAKKVKNIFNKHLKIGEFKVIHAGLEGGILQDKFKDSSIISIGPNIYQPHSIYERVEIKSIDRIYQVLKIILKDI